MSHQTVVNSAQSACIFRIYFFKKTFRFPQNSEALQMSESQVLILEIHFETSEVSINQLRPGSFRHLRDNLLFYDSRDCGYVFNKECVLILYFCHNKLPPIRQLKMTSTYHLTFLEVRSPVQHRSTRSSAQRLTKPKPGCGQGCVPYWRL